MILAFRRRCADHRAALIDFVDRGARSAATPAALAHLDRCRECEHELVRIALTIAALRRLRPARTEEPAADAWERLRARIQRPVERWRWRATLGGLVTSTLLVGVAVAPIVIGQPMPPRAAVVESQRAAVAAERAYLVNARTGDLPPTPQATGGGVPRTYPPEIQEIRKEVPPVQPSRRPPEPI